MISIDGKLIYIFIYQDAIGNILIANNLSLINNKMNIKLRFLLIFQLVRVKIFQ